MRSAALLAVFTLASLGSSAHALPSPRTRTVPCDEIIGQATSPRANGYRLVLGVVSVPPAYLSQVVHLRGRRWPYWRKAGFVVRAGRSVVDVSVPKAWRNGAAITWGNDIGGVSSLQIAPCPFPPGVWNAYAGGFYLSSHSACVPLMIRVGRRTATVRFGVGRRCGATAR